MGSDKLPEKLPVDELKISLDKSKSFEDQAKDLSTYVATVKAFEDERLVDTIAETKKKELTEASKSAFKKELARGKDAEKELQKSLFGIYGGLAEYMGLKRDLPKVMLKAVMFLMQPILGVLLLITGLVAGAINIFLDAINAVVERFANLADSTKKLVRALFWICLVAVFGYLIFWLLGYFKIL